MSILVEAFGPGLQMHLGGGGRYGTFTRDVLLEELYKPTDLRRLNDEEGPEFVVAGNDRVMARTYKLLEEEKLDEEDLTEVMMESGWHRNASVQPLLNIPVFIKASNDDVILNRLRTAGAITLVEEGGDFNDPWRKGFNLLSGNLRFPLIKPIRMSNGILIKQDRAITIREDMTQEDEETYGPELVNFFVIKNRQFVEENRRLFVTARRTEDLVTFYSVGSATPIPRDFVILKPSRVLLAAYEGTGITLKEDDVVIKMANFLGGRYNVTYENFMMAPLERIVQLYGGGGNLHIKNGTQHQSDNYGGRHTQFSFGGRYNNFRLTEELVVYRRNLMENLKDNVILLTSDFLQKNRMFSNIGVTMYDVVFEALDIPIVTIPIGRDEEGNVKHVFLATARGNEYLLIRMLEVLEENFGGFGGKNRNF
ncbi:unnamed protein product [Bursaphelenchus xylophilus]|uniref:(pine wood nematode) hypothetical protein n=1 Tax=Bursaphelenchus xylophilus TaxID=6326 RepID=A0A1I7SL03_BURXY|nr:unnamed protein product [Bursaphelenchus xylophilus]CAG9129318.1 unnamed protein product [Bursaphelenchus xylophilus]